jgi:signal transduction histidine kinase
MRDGGALRTPWRLTATAAGVALLLTAVVLAAPALQFSYRAPALHVALETAEAMIALVVAYLVAGRFRDHRRLQELLLVCGLVVLAGTNLVLSAIPSAVLLSQDQELSRWAPLVARLLGTLLIAAAALASATATVPPHRVRSIVLGVVAVGLLLVLLALILGDRLPPVVDPSVDLSDSTRPLFAGHPLALVAQALSGLLYATAAVAFTAQATRAPDELLRWLGAGCALAAVARVDYLLFPSLYSDFVYLGDAFRLGFYLCLLVGAAREVRSYWARAAVLEDRRRLARDLHDGLTQELSYIWAQSRRLTQGPGDAEVVEQIRGAAGRALDEARQAITALTRPADQAFGLVLQQTVEDLGRRYDIRTVTEIEDFVVVTPEQAEAVLRITAEALRNAVRHGGAGRVRVAFRGEPVRLEVQDDGSGYDPAASSSGGFGLTSMRERAEGLGATFDIGSSPGKGTAVRVVWS